MEGSVGMILRCPICRSILQQDVHRYYCKNRHSFDISKEGYVNLLQKQGHKEYGDSIEMVRARHQFFIHDYYAPLKETILSLVKQYHPSHIVDCGCGEGYYTNYLADQLPDIDVVGADISKEAVRYASKNSRAQYIVASIQKLPMFDECTDLVLNCFAPIDLEETYRLLQSQGIFLTITANTEHLLEFKQALYEDVYLNEVNYIKDERFKLIQETEKEFYIQLDQPERIKELFMMTPYYFRSDKTVYEKLEQLSSIRTKCSFKLHVYQKI